MAFFGYRKTIVGDAQRTLKFRNEQLEAILTPGVYSAWTFKDAIEFLTLPVSEQPIPLANLEVVMKRNSKLLGEHMESVKTSDNEIALVYLDDNLTDIVEPATVTAFWKARGEWRFDRTSMTGDARVPDALVRALSNSRRRSIIDRAAQLIQFVDVGINATALVTESGNLIATLGPGSYGFWKHGRAVQSRLIDGRQQTMDITGQEILTRDRVSLRLNLSAQLRINDPLTVVNEHTDYKDAVYRTLQLELREVVGTRTLDDLLAEKDALNQSLFTKSKEKLNAYGVDLVQIGVRDIILPGEMKTLLNQVVEAQKMAEANLIKRREETAATRSLHNTAKVMEGNATLLRLKELEVLERVSEQVNTISVYGGLDGLMTDLVKIPNSQN